MSRLDKLIEKFCPDGVEFCKLKDVAEIGTGSSDRKNATDDGIYPFYVRSKDILKINNYEFDEEAIVIPGEGGIGEIFHLVKGKYALHQRAYRIHLKKKDVLIGFLFHYMKSNFKAFINKKAVSATVTSIRKPMIEEFKLPVPPLEVQAEIVRILVNFTELEKELEKELELRRKQYEYYRDLLLDFRDVHAGGTNAYSVPWLADMLHELCPDGVEYRKLAEIFNTKNGYTPSKVNKDYWNNGTVPWFRMEDIRENGTILNHAIQNVSETAIKGSLFPADSIIVATSATIGQHALIKVPSIANQRFTYLMVKEDFKEQFDVKFLYYYCFKLDEYCKECLNQGNFAAVDMKKFAKFEFSIPPLSVQQRIVDILDRFDALCNDISSGLPAEIALRRKQYEYYRDKLLNFKELKEA